MSAGGSACEYSIAVQMYTGDGKTKKSPSICSVRYASPFMCSRPKTIQEEKGHQSLKLKNFTALLSIGNERNTVNAFFHFMLFMSQRRSYFRMLF